MANKSFCDKCKKEIVENKATLCLEQKNCQNIYLNDCKQYDLCNNCYQILIRVLAEYLPQ